jgi:hypothetical protein
MSCRIANLSTVAKTDSPIAVSALVRIESATRLLLSRPLDKRTFLIPSSNLLAIPKIDTMRMK